MITVLELGTRQSKKEKRLRLGFPVTPKKIKGLVIVTGMKPVKLARHSGKSTKWFLCNSTV